MKKSFAIRIAIAIAVLGVIFLVTGRSPRIPEEQPESGLSRHDHEAISHPSSLPTKTAANGPDDQFMEEGVFPQMSELEFDRFRVKLPKPVNAPWKGPFFNSEDIYRKELKLTAVHVLAIWIRKAVHEGKMGIAARFLCSLMRLSEDNNMEVATGAVFQIYRLGDIDGFAVNRMRHWIEDGVSYMTIISKNGESVYMDIRSRALDEIEFSGDKSLDDVIFQTWRKHQGNEGKQAAAVDYAAYLEKHGHELPADYWMQRLDSPYGFESALEISEKKAMPELAAKLQSLFERLKVSRPDSLDAGRAAVVASALFRQTGDTRYRDYLADNANAQLGAKSFESSLKKLLPGLAATNDKNAIQIVVGAMQHPNGVVRDTAIDALGNTQDPAATEALFEAAIQIAKEKQWFPKNEMRALLRQQNANADAKYDRLKQALLSGKFGWSAGTSDFDALEFFRKHGHQ